MNEEPPIPSWTNWKPPKDTKVKKEIRDRQYRQMQIIKARNGVRGLKTYRCPFCDATFMKLI